MNFTDFLQQNTCTVLQELFKLGWRDSNPRMRESKSPALPLGYTPRSHRTAALTVCITVLMTVIEDMPSADCDSDFIRVIKSPYRLYKKAEFETTA